MRTRLEEFVAFLWFLAIAAVAVVLFMLYYLKKPVTIPVIVAVGIAFAVTTAAHLFLTWRREKAQKKGSAK